MANPVLLLLVEDEEILHLPLEDGLETAGFSLVIVNTGTAAMSELDADVGRFHAILTDIRLGDGPSGWDVGRHARALAPDIPVVYMSGDSAGDWTSQGVPNSIMVQKPFVMAQIITAISTLLNQSST